MPHQVHHIAPRYPGSSHALSNVLFETQPKVLTRSSARAEPIHSLPLEVTKLTLRPANCFRSAFSKYLHRTDQNAPGNTRLRLVQDHQPVASSADSRRTGAISSKLVVGRHQYVASEGQRLRPHDRRPDQSASPGFR